MKTKYLLLLYALLSVAEITGDVLHIDTLIFATKPLLMPVLLLWFLSATHPNNSFRVIIIASIIAAFFGDTFLLFVPQNEIFFLPGLASFLVGQVLYGIGFIKNIKASNNKGDLRLYLLFAIAFGTFYLLLIGNLWSSLGEFLAPVVIYGLAICFMGLTAAYRYNKVVFHSYWYILAGALTFVASDSVIAINKFIYNEQMPMAQAIIMLTYCTAQFLIVKGCIVYLESDKQEEATTND